MGVNVYRSSDASAPVLSGTAGGLTTLLDAVLVNGYGAKPAAGWSIYKTGTNKRIYQQGAGPALYLRVNDAAAGAGGAKEALIKGCEGATDINTVSNPMPTVAQSTLTENSWVVRKSATADSTARSWIIVADASTLYMWIATNDLPGRYFGWGFGEFYSSVTADAWNNFIIARNTENSGGSTIGDLDNETNQAGMNVADKASGIQRSYTGTSGAVLMCQSELAGAINGSNAIIGSNSAIAYPNPGDSGFYSRRIYLHESAIPSIRGHLRGLWSPAQNSNTLSDGDTGGGIGDLSGKTFLLIKASAQFGSFLVEISDTWDDSP